MGSLGGGGGHAEGQGLPPRRPRFLCLHGFRTSAEIMRKQVLGKWPADVTARLDLVFADAPFPAEGKSEVEGIFDPPYYEWFQFDKVRHHLSQRVALCGSDFFLSPFPQRRFFSALIFVSSSELNRILQSTRTSTSVWLTSRS
jgi:hypothetical protein